MFQLPKNIVQTRRVTKHKIKVINGKNKKNTPGPLSGESGVNVVIELKPTFSL